MAGIKRQHTKRRPAEAIVRRLQTKDRQAYFAGGCVRDLVMRRKPKDYDVVTDAVPAEISRLFRRTIPVGRRFGMVLVIEHGIPIEVSTFRGARAGGFSRSPEADVRKRDFTVNGLLYDPVRREIFDYVGGREDIRRKTIRFIGDPDERVGEDGLRLIRAVRLAAELGFEIEKKSHAVLRRRAGEISRVSRERVRDELVKILTGPAPARAFRMLDDTGLLPVILPEVAAMKGVKQPEEFHPEGDVFTHTLLMLDRLAGSSPTLALAVLLHDVGKPATFSVSDRIRFDGHDRRGAEMTKEIMKRLRFSNAETNRVVAGVENHMRVLNALRMRPATRERMFLRETFLEELELHRLDCLASHGDLSVWRFLKRRYGEFRKRPPPVKPLLNGHDLIGLGWREGPGIGRVLCRLLELQLAGKLKTKDEARRWVKALPRDPGPPAER